MQLDFFSKMDTQLQQAGGEGQYFLRVELGSASSTKLRLTFLHYQKQGCPLCQTQETKAT